MPAMRVRFAPSPTGFLHVGGARTAIFNWLLARQGDGIFVLRVEDTDQARSSEAMTQAILDGMEWLGLTADEGPFFQSAGRDRHAEAAMQLLSDGKAYRDFSPPNPEASAEDRQAGLDESRGLSDTDSIRRAEGGETFAVRFRSPREGHVAWRDRVHGETKFPAEGIEDFVLLRSDGSPTYMLSVVCDDMEMQISDVVRGDDHLSNTPKQILLYRALGAEPPRFTHLPLILGTDKKRLSKRHGAVSVLAYRDLGYLPEAMLNFLALLGWSPGDNREVFQPAELIEAFDLDRIGRSGAVFDLEKLGAINREHFILMSPTQLSSRVRPWMEEAGLWRDEFETDRRSWFHDLLTLLRDRARTLPDLVDFARPFLLPDDQLTYDEAAAKKHLKGEDLLQRLDAWADRLETTEAWKADALEVDLRAMAESREIGAGKLIHPTRLALTGRGVSPGLFEVMELVGREASIRRIRRLRDFAADRRS